MLTTRWHVYEETATGTQEVEYPFLPTYDQERAMQAAATLRQLRNGANVWAAPRTIEAEYRRIPIGTVGCNTPPEGESSCVPVDRQAKWIWIGRYKFTQQQAMYLSVLLTEAVSQTVLLGDSELDGELVECGSAQTVPAAASA